MALTVMYKKDSKSGKVKKCSADTRQVDALKCAGWRSTNPALDAVKPVAPKVVPKVVPKVSD